MQDLAEGMRILAGQLDRLKEVPKSEELCNTINNFPGMMKEVVDFIDKWLESWSGAYSAGWDRVTTESLVAAKHILVVPHKEKAIELQKRLDAFAGQFDRSLLIEIKAEQGLVFDINENWYKHNPIWGEFWACSRSSWLVGMGVVSDTQLRCENLRLFNASARSPLKESGRPGKDEAVNESSRRQRLSRGRDLWTTQVTRCMNSELDIVVPWLRMDVPWRRSDPKPPWMSSEGRGVEQW